MMFNLLKTVGLGDVDEQHIEKVCGEAVPNMTFKN